MTDDIPSDSAEHTFELIRKYRGGSLDALNALFERYYPKVLACVRARMGDRLRQKEDSADLVQYTFAAALKDFDRFELRNEGSFLHWLVVVAENQVRGRIDHWQTDQRDPALEQQLKQVSVSMTSDAFHFEPVARDLTPAGYTAASDRARLVAEALSELSEDHREVILHRRIEGLSLEETRRCMGRETVQAVAMLQARALVELNRLLTKKIGRTSCD